MLYSLGLDICRIMRFRSPMAKTIFRTGQLQSRNIWYQIENASALSISQSRIGFTRVIYYYCNPDIDNPATIKCNGNGIIVVVIVVWWVVLEYVLRTLYAFILIYNSITSMHSTILTMHANIFCRQIINSNKGTTIHLLYLKPRCARDE